MKRSLLIAILLVVYYCFSPSANGQIGVLDQAFGIGGKVITPQSGPSDRGTNVGLQSNGKIIVVGNAGIFAGNGFAVRRYLTNGTVDSSFGTNGIAGKAINIDDQTSCIAIQPDDKILLGGSTNVGFMTAETDFVIIRFTANGIIDSTFGYNGVTTIDFSSSAENRDYMNSLFIRPNGNILACGSSGDGFTGSNGFAMAQLFPNGYLDTTFGSNGRTLVSSYGNQANAYVLLTNGKIIAGGDIGRAIGGSDGFHVVRFTANGHLDSTFGNAGFSADSLINFSVVINAVTKEGNILFAGNFSVNYAGISLVQYDSTGHLDSAFGNSGVATTLIRDINALNYYYGTPTKLLLDSSGKLLLSGSINSKFLLARINTNGTLDSSFGRRGIIATDFSAFNDQANGVVLQPDGKILLAGTAGINPNSSGFALARYEKDARLKYNTLHFSAFIDYNLNSIKDPTEPYFQNANAMVIKQGGDTVLAHSSTGFFEVDVDTGAYKTYVSTTPAYYVTVPSFYNTVLGTYFHDDTFAVAMQPIPGIYDIAVSVVPMSVVRPGFVAKYKVLCYNKGTSTISSGSFSFIKDNRFNYGSASQIPNTISGDTLTWNFSNLSSLDSISVEVNLLVKTPPIVQAGDTLSCRAITHNLPTESNTNDNVASIIQIVRNSYDPNDKTENHGGKITTTQVTGGEYLQYTIRFQNTGNDTAFNVYIHDTLDNKLDWNTMQLLTASANYQMTITDGNKCRFTFRNINLVDSTHNEPGSHGYIVYKIKPKANVQIGDVITNTATIYFDYNLPIYTNTEMTNVVAETFPLKLLTFTAVQRRSSPSPGEGRGEVLLNWTTANEINVDHFIVERSSSGRDFSTIATVKADNTGNYHYIDNNPFASPLSNSAGEGPGVRFYRLKIIDKDGRFTFSPIRVISNNSTFNITIYPNPAKDHLQLQIDSDKKSVLQIQILSTDGKVLQSSNFSTTEGSALRSINISSLQKGNYFVRVISLNPLSEGREGQESVIKFEKL